MKPTYNILHNISIETLHQSNPSDIRTPPLSCNTYVHYLILMSNINVNLPAFSPIRMYIFTSSLVLNFKTGKHGKFIGYIYIDQLPTNCGFRLKLRNTSNRVTHLYFNEQLLLLRLFSESLHENYFKYYIRKKMDYKIWHNNVIKSVPPFY